MEQFNVYYISIDGDKALAMTIEAKSAQNAIDQVCEIKRWNDDDMWAVPVSEDVR